MASVNLESSEWAKVPSYPALYLSTTAEYLPPAPKPDPPVVDDIPDDNGDGKKNKDATWLLEGYENSLDIDHTFERFSKRVGYEAEQCMRYLYSILIYQPSLTILCQGMSWAARRCRSLATKSLTDFSPSLLQSTDP